MNKKVKFIGILIGFLAITGVGSSVVYFLREPYNLGFNKFPIITALHVIPGAIYSTSTLSVHYSNPVPMD